MFYPKMLKTKKLKYYKISFASFAKGMNTNTDDSLMSHQSAKLTYNFKFDKGALCDGIGFEQLSLPKSYEDIDDQRQIMFEDDDNITAMWLYKYYNPETQMPEFKLQYFSKNEVSYCFIVKEHPFTNVLASIIYSDSTPLAINYRLNGEDVMIYSSESEGMWVYKENYMAQKIDDALTFRSMCIHYERMFAILENGERNRLSFSEDLDPTNWNVSLEEGGFIDMPDERGSLNKVVSFNDYVYVFRDYGVSKISAYGEQTGFNLSHLFVSGSKIYGNSVCVCGNKILLLNSEGIHIFDGYSTNKIELGIDELFAGVSNESCSAIYANNKYYIALRLNFNDNELIGCESTDGGYVNNALIELDLDTYEYNICRGVDINSMLYINDPHFTKIVASFNGTHKNKIGQLCYNGKIFNEVLPKKWVSPKSNISLATKDKFVKEIFIKTKSECSVVFETDYQTKKYKIVGKDVSQRIKTNVKGEQIQISFESCSDEKTHICLPQIVLGVAQ